MPAVGAVWIIVKALNVKISMPIFAHRLWIEGFGFRVQTLGLKASGSRFMVYGSGFRVEGLRFKVRGRSHPGEPMSPKP